MMMSVNSEARPKHKPQNCILRAGSIYVMTLRANAEKKDLNNL